MRPAHKHTALVFSQMASAIISHFPRSQTKMERKLEQEETWDQGAACAFQVDRKSWEVELTKKTEHSFNSLLGTLSTSLSPSVGRAAHT